MNRIIKAFAAFIVSICLILAPPMAYAASPAGWVTSPADIIIGAAGNTVTAIKGAGASALQSTVQHAPTVANIGKKILKGAGAGAVLMAVSQILGKAVDYVLDPANNRIKYMDTQITPVGTYQVSGGAVSNTPEDACRSAIANSTAGDGRVYHSVSYGTNGAVKQCHFVLPNGTVYAMNFTTSQGSIPQPVEKYIPISTVASKVQSNAAAGDTASQDLVKTVIIDDVNAGYVDNKLNVNAVPVADAPPVNPPYDPDAPVVPFDPSSIIAAIKSVMSAVVNMSGILGAKIDALMIEIGLKQAETIEAINAGTGEIVAANDRTGAQVAAMAAAIEATEGNTLTGEVINDAIDRAIAAGNTNTSDIVAAIEAIEGNTLDGQVINDAVDRVIANDNANAQSAADAATAASDAAKAADVANTTAVTDAIDAQTDAISEADPVTGKTALKFPAFCGWAETVCTFADWAMADPQLEEPDMTTPEIQDIDKYDSIDLNQGYISASGQCPPAADLNINFGVVKLSYEPLCIILDKLSGVIVAVAYISGGYMIIRSL